MTPPISIEIVEQIPGAMSVWLVGGAGMRVLLSDSMVYALEDAAQRLHDLANTVDSRVAAERVTAK